MRTSLNPLMYNTLSYSKLFESAGTYKILLSKGVYQSAMRGGGGAGGTSGKTYSQYNGGTGGAGGSGNITTEIIVVKEPVVAQVVVGAGGKTFANGGNGGYGGASSGNNTDGGGGGGGGWPTYVQFSAPVRVGDQYVDGLSADGGGGGGGGGGAGSPQGRYSDGGGGGGGGGYYRLENTGGQINVISVAGKNGGIGAMATSGSYISPGAGHNGNVVDFPDVYSGAGAQGDNGPGADGASGGGASGGGGGGGWNDSNANAGGGGGGAGGSMNAGGGTGGQEQYFTGESAYNPTSTPTPSTNYLGQPSNLGMGGQGGTASQTATNGYNGWFYILKIQNATPWDMGGITDTVTNTVDCGQITETTNMFLQMGTIA